MKILEAIENLSCGFYLRRACWGKGLYIKQSGNMIHLVYEGPEGTKLISTDEKFSLNDINADDWVLKS